MGGRITPSGALRPAVERKERLLDQLELALDELTTSATEDALAAEKAAARTTEVKGFVRRKPSRKPFPERPNSASQCLIPTAFNIDRYGPIFAFRLM